MRIFIYNLMVGIVFFSFSLDADIKKLPSSQQLGYKTGISPKVKIVDYDVGRDFKAVKQILKESWATLATCPYSEEIVQELFVRCNSCNYSGNKTTVKVAQINGQTVGFVTFIHDSSFYRTHGMVELLAVDSKFRNHGVGYKLLLAAQDLALKNNAAGIDLYVFENNFPAIKLYEKFGFRNKTDQLAHSQVMLMRKDFNIQHEHFVALA